MNWEKKYHLSEVQNLHLILRKHENQIWDSFYITAGLRSSKMSLSQKKKKKPEVSQIKREERQDNWTQCTLLYQVLYQGKQTATVDVLGIKEDQNMPPLNVPIWHKATERRQTQVELSVPSTPA